MAVLQRLLNKYLKVKVIIQISTICAMAAAVNASTGIYIYTDSQGIMHIGNSDRIRDRGTLLIEESPKYREPTDKERRDIMSMVENTARQFGICPYLAKAVAKAESSFQVNAVSPKGAIGVMQLMPDTAKRFNVKDIYNPQENIEGGIRYLKYLMEMFPSDVSLAIAAYNSGENRVQRLGRIPHIQETQEFVDRVIRFYNGFRGVTSDPSQPATIPARVRKSVRTDGTIVLSNL
jgi:hypothetical protein